MARTNTNSLAVLQYGKKSHNSPGSTRSRTNNSNKKNPTKSQNRTRTLPTNPRSRTTIPTNKTLLERISNTKNHGEKAYKTQKQGYLRTMSPQPNHPGTARAEGWDDPTPTTPKPNPRTNPIPKKPVDPAGPDRYRGGAKPCESYARGPPGVAHGSVTRA